LRLSEPKEIITKFASITSRAKKDTACWSFIFTNITNCIGRKMLTLNKVEIASSKKKGSRNAYNYSDKREPKVDIESCSIHRSVFSKK
jgi:hypothetical protein